MALSSDISIIVPTIAGREEWLKKCLAAYKLTAPEAEIIIITDEESCGLAWIKGAEQATRKYLHFTADDIEPHDGWWQTAIETVERGEVPAATVVDANGSLATCNTHLDKWGKHPNVLVPFLSREQLEMGEWLQPFHYGTDDWISYKAVQLGLKIRLLPTYKFTHHAAIEGRSMARRPEDVRQLVEAMEKAGYLPPAYQNVLTMLTRANSPKALQRLEDKQRRKQQHIERRARRVAERDARRLARGHARPTRPMIYTASPFKNEVDVLEIRLETIGHLVDKIVLAEATVDQRGRPKELVFPQHRERFAKWADKIEYVTVDDMPKGEGRFYDVQRERFQRDALIRGMPQLQRSDLVYVSDLDEIPYPEALEEALANPPMRFVMDMFVYRLNWRWLDRDCKIGTLGAVVLGKNILRKGVCWSVLDDIRVPRRPGLSGWHLTYQGDIETLRSKMTGMMDNFYEQLVTDDLKAAGWTPEDFLTDEWIQESIDTGRDIYAREYRPSEWVPITELPQFVQDHPDKFKHMLVPEPTEKPSGPRCTCGGIFSPDNELAHFTHCVLAGVPDTLLCTDSREFKRLSCASS